MQSSSRWSDAFVLGSIAIAAVVANTDNPGGNMLLLILALPSLFVFGAMVAENFLGKK